MIGGLKVWKKVSEIWNLSLMVRISIWSWKGGSELDYDGVIDYGNIDCNI